MRAIGHYIVIDEIKESVKKTDGGLLLTDKHTQDIRYVKGKGVSPGSAVKGVKAGETILFDRVAGHGIEIDGDFHKVITERDIVLVL